MFSFLHGKSYLMAVIGAVFIWSASFVATKVAFRSFPPLTLGALRFIIAAIMLGTVLCVQKGFTRPARQDLGRLLISGLLGITLYFSMENWGVKLATAADASLIVASYPAITILLEMVLYRTSVSAIRLAGVALAILGVYLIVSESSHIGSAHHLIGDIILAATGIVWAFYNFLTRKVVHRYPAILITFFQTVAGAIAFLPLALTERAAWRLPNPVSLLTLFYLAVFCSVVAFLLYAHGLKELSASSAVTVMNLVPVFGVIFSLLFLREPIGLLQILGGLVVIAGIVLSVRKVGKEKVSRKSLAIEPE